MSQRIKNECIYCKNGYYRDDKDEITEKCHLRGENHNCKTPHPLSLECEECEFPTQIKHFLNRFCSDAIDGCEVYNTDSEILSCKFCQKNSYYDQNQRACLQNTSNFDPNCSLYNSDKTCATCMLGFFYNSISQLCETNEKEYKEKSKCKVYKHNRKNVCEECDVGHT